MSKLNLCLIGENIKKSPSPLIHNYIYKMFNIEAEYRLCEIKRDSFDSSILNLLNSFYGLNVTMPYKEKILGFLKNYSDDVKKIGAVNTIKNGVGFNTDYLAFKKTISEYKDNLKEAIVIGAGGAAKAAVFALIELGFDKIFIYNRTKEKAMGLSKIIQSYGIKSNIIENLNDLNTDVLINTVPVDLNISIKNVNLYIDIVYTRKIREFSKNLIDGIDFLIEQALFSEEIWFGLNIGEEVKNYVRKLVRETI